MSMTEKQFAFTILDKSPSLNVIGHANSTLESVWNSQKSWVSEGTKVLISDGEHSRIFVKEPAVIPTEESKQSPLKKRFYTELELQKDAEFSRIMLELDGDERVFVIRAPERALVYRETNNSAWRKDSEADDKALIGYVAHYVTFAYEDFIFYVEGAPFYPFCDNNHPGRFNFIAYQRNGLTGKIQFSFFQKYEGLSSLRTWLKEHPFGGSPKRGAEKIDYKVPECYASRIIRRIASHGGAREKEVIRSHPLFLSTETWNDEHKVVNVISGHPETDGYRSSFEFDLVTEKICG